MKKNNYSILISSMVLLFSSCNHLISNSSFINESISENGKINSINNKVSLLKDFFYENQSRSISDSIQNYNIPEESKKDFYNFIENPIDYFESNNSDLNASNAELELIYALYEGTTVDDLILKMDSVDEKLSSAYKQELNNFYESTIENHRSIDWNNYNIGSSQVGLTRDMCSVFFQPTTRCLDFILDCTFNWDSVTRYVAYGATAIAGSLCYQFGILPWITTPALGVCLVGLSGMTVLILKWQTSPEIKLLTNVTISIVNAINHYNSLGKIDSSEKLASFYESITKSLMNYIKNDPRNASNYEALIKIIVNEITKTYDVAEGIVKILQYSFENKESGKKIATVSLTTISVGCSCWFTGVAGVLVEQWKTICSFIPTWLDIGIDHLGVTLTI